MSKKKVPIRDHEYVVSVWFERDRANVTLSKPSGEEIFSLWDDAVFEAIEDGFLSAPKGPMFSSASMNDDEAWRSSVLAYAREFDLIP